MSQDILAWKQKSTFRLARPKPLGSAVEKALFDPIQTVHNEKNAFSEVRNILEF